MFTSSLSLKSKIAVLLIPGLIAACGEGSKSNDTEAANAKLKAAGVDQIQVDFKQVSFGRYETSLGLKPGAKGQFKMKLFKLTTNSRQEMAEHDLVTKKYDLTCESGEKFELSFIVKSPEIRNPFVVEMPLNCPVDLRIESKINAATLPEQIENLILTSKAVLEFTKSQDLSIQNLTTEAGSKIVTYTNPSGAGPGPLPEPPHVGFEVRSFSGELEVMLFGLNGQFSIPQGPGQNGGNTPSFRFETNESRSAHLKISLQPGAGQTGNPKGKDGTCGQVAVSKHLKGHITLEKSDLATKTCPQTTDSILAL